MPKKTFENRKRSAKMFVILFTNIISFRYQLNRKLNNFTCGTVYRATVHFLVLATAIIVFRLSLKTNLTFKLFFTTNI